MRPDEMYREGSGDFLRAEDLNGTRVTVTIEGVDEVTFPARDGKPEATFATLSFVGKDRGLVVRPTNGRTLVAAFGGVSFDSWIGRSIELEPSSSQVGPWIKVNVPQPAGEVEF